MGAGDEGLPAAAAQIALCTIPPGPVLYDTAAITVDTGPPGLTSILRERSGAQSGSDSPGARSQGMKQLMAGGGVALIEGVLQMAS